jgi:Ca2+-binding EF-hand superfamily protein
MRVESLLLVLLVSGAALAQADDYFSRVDLDGDGRVSRSEFLERMSFAFRQMDVDGDGVLQPHEQHVPNARTITLAQLHARFGAQFDRQDTDGDGYLGRRELSAPPQ